MSGENKASLLCRGGARAGACFPLRDGVTRVGRAPDNDAVIDGPDAAVVSQYHCEIARDGAGFRVRDANSRNGTWVNGVRAAESMVGAGAVLRLGQQGPEFDCSGGGGGTAGGNGGTAVGGLGDGGGRGRHPRGNAHG